jgi:hypothetical protein
MGGEAEPIELGQSSAHGAGIRVSGRGGQLSKPPRMTLSDGDR